MKIIVRMPNWIGDCVMATPVLADLRARFPHAQITAMCLAPVCDLLKKEPAIDELFCFTRPINDFARRESRDIIAKIEAGKYDLGILLTNSFSSAWWFWQAGIKKRIGYRGHFRKWLLTDALAPQKGHTVFSYKHLLAPLNIPLSKTAPKLYLSPDEIEEAKKLLYRFGYKKGGPLVGINPGAAYGSAKCWPPERFRELAQKLELPVVFFGDSSQSALVKQICRDLPSRVIDLAGLSTLRELACIISQCSVLVTNDSGPSHIGAALNVPLVALFGSTDPASTAPFGQEHNVIHKKVPCSPCFKRTCPIDFPCMKEISVDEVFEKVLFHVSNV